LGLGLAVDSESRVIASNGSAHPTLYALGSLTRGTRWEVTAVPEIREQANAIVRRVLHERASDRVVNESASHSSFLPEAPAGVVFAALGA
jgi:uncharacterized NAD(P)/FAD-binding protein YdhS